MKRPTPKTLKYIGKSTEFIFGKTYFVHSINGPFCTVFARNIDDHIKISLLTDLKTNFIEAVDFHSHVSKMIHK